MSEKCPTCGEPTELRVVERPKAITAPDGSASNFASMRTARVCTNPDCPTIESNLAPMAEP